MNMLERRLLHLEAVAGRRLYRNLSDEELDAASAAALAAFGAGIPALELAVAEHGLSAGGTALQQPRRLGHAAAVGQPAADAIDLELRHGRPAQASIGSAGAIQPGRYPVADHRALELGEDAQHAEQHPP